MTKKRSARRVILKDFFFIVFIIAVIIIVLRLLSKMSFFIQLDLSKIGNLASWWVWILFLGGFLGWLVILICQPVKYFIVNLLKSLKYRWIDISITKEKAPCDFSPEKPIELSSQNELGFSYLAERIFNAIEEFKSADTLIFGLNGRIGIGKSSLMNLIKEEFKEKFSNEKDFIIVSFNAWHYKDVDALLKGFIKAVLKSLKDKIGISVPKAHMKDWDVALGLTLGLSPSIDIKGNPSEKISIEGSKENIGKWLESKGLKLVIFMDDLDRCDKREILFTLKLLRYFANFKHTFFVIGYDKKRVSSIVNTDIEKFVDQEVPVEIERVVLYEWFWKKARKCEELSNELDKIRQASLRDDFERIIFNYCSTPRKVKLILNDLLIALPLIKNKVYFPHFVIVTILKRDMPELYNSLSSGNHWILKEGAALETGKTQDKEYNLKLEISRIAKNLYKDTERIRKMYEYLNILGGDLIFDRSLGKGPTIGIDPNKTKNIQFDGDKYIWREGFTETYFLWKESSGIYSESLFDDFLNRLKEVKEEVAKDRIIKELERIQMNRQIKGVFKLIIIKANKIKEMELSEAFLKGIAGAKYQSEFSRDAASTALSLLFTYPKNERFKRLKTVVENTTGPLFLHLFFEESELKEKLADWFNQQEIAELKKLVENQFDRIFTQPLRCLCKFDLPHDRILIFKSWGNPEKVADYLRKLSRNSIYHSHANEIISHIRNDTSPDDSFFNNVTEILEKDTYTDKNADE